MGETTIIGNKRRDEEPYKISQIHMLIFLFCRETQVSRTL